MNGSTVVAEKWTEQIVEHMLVYVYDEFGAPIAIQYRNTNYLEGDFDIFFLERNMFGDIIGIYNEAGERIGVYSYDAWGMVSSSYDYADEELEYLMVDEYTPFGYRGYFYDRESNLYYLQSRYYSPLKGRFINADGYVSTGQGLLGYNMFAYCGNNPIMNTDPTGEFPILMCMASIAVVLVATGVDHYLASNYPNGEQIIQDNDGNSMTDKKLYGEGSGISYKDETLTIFDTTIGGYSGVAEYENAEISLATFLTADAALQVSAMGANVSAMASIYTMYGSYSFQIFNRNITLTAELNVGAIGGEIKFDPKSGSFAFAPPSAGIVPKLGLEFD